MTITATPTTELEAVNVLLSAIGESPVNSLEDVGLIDVTVAKATLQEILTAVLEKGWHFNTDDEFPLLPDTDGYINVPANALRVEVARSNFDKDAVVRGTRLYDRKNHTMIFTGELKVKMVIGLSYTECPQSMRRYVTIKSARVFQKRMQGSDTQYKFTEDEEVAALVSVTDADLKTRQRNVLGGSWSVAQILDR